MPFAVLAADQSSQSGVRRSRESIDDDDLSEKPGFALTVDVREQVEDELAVYEVVVGHTRSGCEDILHDRGPCKN